MTQSTVFTPDEAALIVASGEICGAASEALRAAGVAKLMDASERVLAVDLAAVTFMDSSGLSALVAIRNAAIATGSRVVLHAPSARALKALEITGLLIAFDVQ
jgi:anti-sigma B factor antagonist